MSGKGNFLRGIGTAWCGAVFFLVMLGFFGIVFTHGLGEAAAIFSPFNIWNTGLIVLLLAPGLLFLFLSERSTSDLDE